MSRQQLKKYIWIIDNVRSAGDRGITLEELNKRWERSWRNDREKPIPWRTFVDDRDAIAELFGIEIYCDKHDNRYRIGKGDEGYEKVRDTLVDALVLSNAIQESPELGKSVSFDYHFHQKCMPEVLRAIKERKTIRFKYRFKYQQQPPQEIDIEPFGLYFCTAWFMVGRSVKYGTLQIYGLHHMSDIEFLDRDYTVPEDFNLEQYMENYNHSDTMLVFPQESDDGNTFDSLKRGLKYDFA